MPFLLLLLLLFPLPLFAQEGSLRLTTSPLPILLSATPGSTITTELKIKNSGTEEETLDISVMKFSSHEDSGKPTLEERQPGDTFLDWVTFREPTFTLPPNEWKTIEATFTIPKDAAFGYYYAFVFQRTEVTPPKEKQTALLGGTAILTLLEVVREDAKKAITLKHFTTDKKFYEFLPVTFSLTLENTGNIHVAPRGNLFIDRGAQRDLAILEVNPQRGQILPHSERTFQTTWEDGFPKYTHREEDGKVIQNEEGEKEMILSFDWKDASKLRFGKYSAKLLLIYDDGTRDIPIESEVSFWVVPWRGMLIFLLVLIFTFIGVRSTFRQIWTKLFQKQETQAS